MRKGNVILLATAVIVVRIALWMISDNNEISASIFLVLAMLLVRSVEYP
jgi:hypothetical protein